MVKSAPSPPTAGDLFPGELQMRSQSPLDLLIVAL